MRKRRAGEARQMIAPVTAPATSDPERPRNQNQAKEGPASLANATMLTSMPPKIMPRALEAIATGTRTSPRGNRPGHARRVDRIGGYDARRPGQQHQSVR